MPWRIVISTPSIMTSAARLITPKMLVSTLLFAYSQGIFSGRKIEKMMIENLAMQYLTGQLVVSYRTINRFRVAEGMEELIRNLFIDLNLRLKYVGR